MTPNVTGIFCSKAISASPLAVSFAIYSLCDVSPFMTAPNAIMASYLPVNAISFAIKGCSHAPGVQKRSMSWCLTS